QTRSWCSGRWSYGWGARQVGLSWLDGPIEDEATAEEGGGRKLRSEGKTYVVADGDIIHFLFNV
ncbi:MAG: DUF933 domain-containing protein, partial [Planctomycetota bacterium]|nr:DUF933 domain-containing protein [Planctomycetota bacterium]